MLNVLTNLAVAIEGGSQDGDHIPMLYLIKNLANSY
jgi:hypothetical protein